MVNPGDVRKAGSLCLQDQGGLHILKALRSWRREHGRTSGLLGPTPLSEVELGGPRGGKVSRQGRGLWLSRDGRCQAKRGKQQVQACPLLLSLLRAQGSALEMEAGGQRNMESSETILVPGIL